MKEKDSARRERLLKEKVESRIHVSMQDVDRSRIHFSTVFSYFDRNESQLLYKVGLAISSMLENGYAMPVVSTGCEYRRPFGLDDQITVTTSIMEIGTKSLKIGHSILDNDGALLAEGFTVHVSIREDSNSAIEMEELFAGMGV